jgi:hypothetical protein
MKVRTSDVEDSVDKQGKDGGRDLENEELRQPTSCSRQRRNDL